MFEAGAAKVRVDPLPGMRLAGFAARKGVCQGVHDSLYVRSLVLANGADAAAIVAIDVLALPAGFVDRVRRAIASKTGIRPDAVMIACTHTHAAPVTITTFFNPDQSVEREYTETLSAAVENSVEEAWRRRSQATAGVGSAIVHGVGVNRRSLDGRPVDDEIGFVRIAGANGETRAVLMNYGCHPTVLGPDNLLASADLPAAAIERIESACGGTAMFVNGAEGDVSVGHSSEGSAIGVIAQGRTFERAAALGTKLGDAVVAAVHTIPTGSDPTIKAAIGTLDLNLREFVPPEPRGNKALDELFLSITNFYAAETASWNGKLDIEVQGIRIGDTMLAAAPAELFVEVGLAIKRSARHRTFVIGVANGYIGYLPDRTAYQTGGYEVISSKVDENAADRLVAGVLELERNLFD